MKQMMSYSVLRVCNAISFTTLSTYFSKWTSGARGCAELQETQ